MSWFEVTKALRLPEVKRTGNLLVVCTVTAKKKLSHSYRSCYSYLQ